MQQEQNNSLLNFAIDKETYSRVLFSTFHSAEDHSYAAGANLVLKRNT